MKVIAGIEDPGAVKQILEHLNRRAGLSPAGLELPLARAPPQGELPGLEDQG